MTDMNNEYSNPSDISDNVITNSDSEIRLNENDRLSAELAKKKTELALPDWDEELQSHQIRFLNAYALGGSVSHACRITKIGRRSPYRWAEKLPVFAQAMQEAKELGVQRLEDWALHRATDADNPSDRLVEFLLKAHRPAVYRERVDVALHGQIEHRKRVVLESLDDSRVVEATNLPETEEPLPE